MLVFEQTLAIIETKECKVRHAFIFALWNAQPILLDGRLFTDCLSTSTDKFSIQMDTGCLIFLYSSFSRPLQEKWYKIISFIFKKKKSVSSTGFIKEIKEFYTTTTITDQARSLLVFLWFQGSRLRQHKQHLLQTAQ